MRDQLAVLSTERYSHGLEDAAETFSLMVDVEQEVGLLYPEVHTALFPRWITSATEVSHEPGEYNKRCGICRADSGSASLPAAA